MLQLTRIGGSRLFWRLLFLVVGIFGLSSLFRFYYEEDATEFIRWKWSNYRLRDGDAAIVDPSAAYPPKPRPSNTREIMPQTTLLRNASGFNILDNVYMANETIFFITDDKSKWPETRLFMSTELELAWNNRLEREPTPWHISLISVEEARSRWGDNVWTVDGLSIFVSEPTHLLHHYYHWVAETWFGVQRFYASLDPYINVYGATNLEDPARFIFRHVDFTDFQRWARINWHLTQSVYPSAGVETWNNWEIRGAMTEDHKSVWRFDKMLMVDRGATFRNERVPGRNHRMAWSAYEATEKVSSRWWWEPIRRRALEAARVSADIINIPTIWKDWEGHFRGDYPPTQEDMKILREAHRKIDIVVTYISRQPHRRSMEPEQEKLFVEEVSELCKRRGWKFNHAFMQDMTPQEQIAMAAETTIMIGVHGNGLSHLIWMPLTPLTTVMEIFIPGGFAKDYEWTSRALGMTHYSIWNDTAFMHPDEPKVAYPEGDTGFHSKLIPVHGPSVARMIERRVDGRIIGM